MASFIIGANIKNDDSGGFAENPESKVNGKAAKKINKSLLLTAVLIAGKAAIAVHNLWLILCKLFSINSENLFFTIVKPMNVKLRPVTFEDKLSGIIGLVIGLMFIGAGFWVNQQEARERVTLLETQGKVVDTVHRRERDTKDKQKDTYAPVIEFLVKGDPVRFTGNYESYRTSQGEIVTVRYDPKQPATTAREVEPFASFAPWVALGMGGLSLVSGLRQLSPVSLSWSD